jgi:hypothetical protein
VQFHGRRVIETARPLSHARLGKWCGQRDELVHVGRAERALPIAKKVAVVIGGIRLERDVRSPPITVMLRMPRIAPPLLQLPSHAPPPACPRGSVTVAAGARMRGKAELGWDEADGSKAGKHHYIFTRSVEAVSAKGKSPGKGGTHH